MVKESYRLNPFLIRATFERTAVHLMLESPDTVLIPF